MPRKNNAPNNVNVSFIDKERISYEYPGKLNLHPDGELHRELLKKILEATKESNDVMAERFDAWRELDEKLSVYIEIPEEEEKIQDEDARKPVSIVVPISYATRESLLTYWTAAFIQQPIFRYIPSRDPKDTLGVLLLENIIEQHCIRSKVALEMHTMWSDAFTYGFGAVSPTWRVERGYRTDKATGVREPVKQFEGNALVSLDPYNCLPDPNVPIVKVQDMDFFGWVERTTYYKLLDEEKYSDGELFNVRYLDEMAIKSSCYFNADDSETGRYAKQDLGEPRFSGVARPTDLIHMYMRIIPSELGLSKSEYPEIWKFTVAADRVIIEAKEMGLDHNKIPVCTMSPDSDGHTTLPVSILEREYPMQHAIDWLWLSHVASVRKNNNMFIVDPSLVNINDVVDSKFGMLARLRAAAWGRGVKDVMAQLPTTDVTQSHISDIGFLMGIDNMVFTSPQSKGVQERRGERVSAQEARDTRMSFLSKMEKNAKMGAIQAHYDIGYQFAANTIQLLDEEQYVRVTGDYERVLKEEYGVNTQFVKVSPEALDVRYDVVPQDGTIPGGEYSDVWERLMQAAAQHPELYQQIDFVRVWKHVARLLGARNPEDFIKKGAQVQVQPQEQIEQGVQAGNLVKPEQLGGGNV